MKDSASSGKSSASSVSELSLKRASDLLLEERRSPLVTPVGTFERGALYELTGGRSSGRFAAALAVTAAAMKDGASAAWVDLGDHLDPAGARAAGVPLERLLWARPRSAKQALLAAETLLAAGFPFAALDLGVRPKLDRVPDAAWLRLARTAAAHKSVLLLVSPRAVAGTAASAVVSFEQSKARWLGAGREPRLLAGVTAKLRVRGRRGPDSERPLSLRVRT